MVKLNYELLPVKAHYFFFMAAMGPILPFLPVFGKHLGVSELVIGWLNGAIPLLFLGLKPLFGFLLDFHQGRRKAIFLCLISLMGGFFCLMSLIPDGLSLVNQEIGISEIGLCQGKIHGFTPTILRCGNETLRSGILKGETGFCSLSELGNLTDLDSADSSCQASYHRRQDSFYSGFSFWFFVLLSTLGTIGYNISNSISDVICFDVLGEDRQLSYGQQRVWGTIGFGLTALLGGCLMSGAEAEEDLTESFVRDFLPALCICGLCIILDLLCCTKLKIPPLPKSENIVRDIWNLIRQPHIATFLIFAVLVGICDSSIIFYLLWYLEDLAKESAEEENIKLIQGLTVAGETLVGEVVSFYLSGRILSKLGFGHCLSLCFFFYFLRLGLLALIPSPWWVLPVELLSQGPTYALCYATIVAYASAIAPPGTSATVQGIVAGMDDGFGFAVGNLICSVVYKYYGGRVMFGSVAVLALACCLLHCALYGLLFRRVSVQTSSKNGKGDRVKGELNDKEDEAAVPLKQERTLSV